MSDLISRQAAIDVLEERLRANGYSNVALVSELNRSIGCLMRLPSVGEYAVVAEFCRKRGLVIITEDLFEKIKREYGGEHWIR